jgi:hypothetical protein
MSLGGAEYIRLAPWKHMTAGAPSVTGVTGRLGADWGSELRLHESDAAGGICPTSPANGVNQWSSTIFSWTL